MKRILIVDDAIDLARLLQDALKIAHTDVAISAVPSAEEALLEATRLSIDLLVTDLRLPGMTGADLIRKIRVRQPQVKVILMTGLSPDDRLMKLKDEARPEIFLRKPISPTVFLEAVDQLLGVAADAEKPASENQEPEKRLAEKAKTGRLQKKEKEAAEAAVLQELAAIMPGEPVEAKPKLARKTTGALKLPPEMDAPVPDQGLAGLLSRLRGSLGAFATMLLDERGRPVAQAGDLPDQSMEAQIIPPVMAALSAGAKISYLLGQASSQSVQAYRGAAFDLVTAPVGQYVLLIVLRTGNSSLRLALAFEETLNVQVELVTALEAMGLHIQSSAEVGAPEVLLAEANAEGEEAEEVIPLEILETPLGQDPGLEKFEELFTRKKTGQLRLVDPDAFWDAASTEGQEVTQSGVLSFEQAQKLGLLPPDDKKE